MQTSVQKTSFADIPSYGRVLDSNPRRFADKAYIVGSDVWVPNTLATAFGGEAEPGGDGSTASGIRTDRPGGVVGCRLPLPTSADCVGTPFAAFPWRTAVEVACEGRTIIVPLIDEGPGGQQSPCQLIQLTIPAFRLLTGLDYGQEEVMYLARWVSFRVLHVAPHMEDYRPSFASYMPPLRG